MAPILPDATDTAPPPGQVPSATLAAPKTVRGGTCGPTRDRTLDGGVRGAAVAPWGRADAARRQGAQPPGRRLPQCLVASLGRDGAGDRTGGRGDGCRSPVGALPRARVE